MASHVGPLTPDVIYESTVRVARDAAGGKASVIAPAWTSEASAGRGNTTPTDAHHRMLHEASALSGHITGLRGALASYGATADRWFAGVQDFISSTGNPSVFHHRLAPQGAAAVKAAAAAARQLATTTTTIISSATAATPTGQAASPAGAALAASAEPPEPVAELTAAEAAGTAFAPAAAEPAALSDATAATSAAGPGRAAGMVLCPSVPGTPALGAATGGLTEVAPADVLLPKQHEALFSHEVQRSLVAAGRSQLQAAISDRLSPSLDTWLEAYKQAKSLLPDLEHCWQQVAAARHDLEAAKADTVQSEAAAGALHSKPSLEAAGHAVPVVLVQGSEGGQLIAEPDRAKRQQLYKAEAAATDAELNFELLEKVLRVRLTWLMQAGAGIKALVASAMAHALRAAAAEGAAGQARGGTAALVSAGTAAAGAAGGGGEPSAGGLLRAPWDELLEPFPEHVLAVLRGEHLPLLQQLVSADHARLARWAQRYRAAMAAAAGADAVAAGAAMLAAAAGAAPVTPAAAGAATLPGAAVPPATPGLALETGLHSTDEPGAAAAGTAAGSLMMPPASVGADTGGSSSGSLNLEQELAAAAAESGLPLDLLAAAVAADVQESAAAAAATADKREIARRLLHDASVVGGKESAVLLPLVAERLGQAAAGQLRAQLEGIEGVLADMGGGSAGVRGATAEGHFDLQVLEVLDVLQEHHQFLEAQILPALAGSSSGSSGSSGGALSEADLRHLAQQYRRAAAAAPTRPHGWLLGSSTGSGGSGGGDDESAAGGGATAAGAGWLAAAGGAAGRALLAAPARAGVRLIDAAADVVRFGPGRAPSKV